LHNPLKMNKSNPFNLSIPELEIMARKLRRYVIQMISTAKSGHPGGSLSSADIVTALYFNILSHKPSDPHWNGRDRFILSKGHVAPILYTALAECGYFPVEELSTLRKFGSRLQGHTDRNLTPGIEMSAGSLGMGLSFGIGVRLALMLESLNQQVYVLLGDGECEEGQIWEAAMSAPHFQVNNLTAIVDYNKIQLDGHCCDIMSLESLADKWKAFNWHVVEIDGHDFNQILPALNTTKNIKNKPVAIIAHTIKGKGVSFMENNVDFHGKAPNAEETAIALKELE
jgi:transketolase